MDIIDQNQTKIDFSGKLIELANVIIIVLDKYANIMVFNKYAEQLTGFSESEVIGKNFIKTLSPKRYQDLKLKAFRDISLEMTENPYDENLIVCKDKSERTIAWNNTTLHDEKNKTSGILSIGIDITGRKQAYIEVKESENSLRSLYNNLNIGIYQTTPDGQILFANPALIRLLGFDSLEDLKKRNLEQSGFNPNYSRELFRKILETDDKIKGLESEWIGKDGKPVYVRENANVFRDNTDKIIYYEGSVEDITEKNLIDQALNQSQVNLNNIFNLTSDAILIQDLKGNIIDVNRSAEILFGYKKLEIINHPEIQIQDNKKIDPRITNKFQKLALKDIAQRFEGWGLKKDGASFPEEIILNKSVYDGKEVILVTIRDITSRKQVEQALKDSEIKHKALINNIPGMIYRGFPDWSSEIISGAKEVCGFTNEEINLLENKWLSIIHPDDIDEVKKIGFDITKRQKAIVQIYRIINKAGLTQWVEDHKTSLFSDDGEFFGIDGIVFNVTDRKLIELALIENERRMSVMLGNLPGMVYRRQNDKNWTIDFISEGCVNITGYTPNNLINNKIESLKNLIHPDDISKVHSRIQKAIKQGTTFENEYRIIMKSGEIKIVWEHGVPIKAENQDKIFIEGYIWDVTARIKGERALKESHDRYEAIFEGVADGIVYVNRKGKILAVNTGFENITGLSKENWIGKNGLDLARKYIPINKLPKLMSQIKPALKGEALKNIIFEYNDQLLEINAPMEKDTPGVTIHVRDITEQIEAQSKLEQARVDLQESHEQLHELSTHMENVREEERTSIAREIHDELGQAMTAIKMDLVWLAKTISDVHPIVIEKTTSTLKIVDDAIKSIKRISTELRPGLLDDLGLSAAIEWQVGEFQSRTGIKCDLMFQPKEIITDQARSTVLFRIMQEALTNVARHSKATRVKIRLKDDHGLLRLTIIDNGIGIADKKIIDPKSYGLKGIQERVYPWRGSVTITGTKGKGTILIAIIPKNE